MAYSLNVLKNHIVLFLILISLSLTSLSVAADDNVLVIKGKADIFEEVLKGIRDDIDNEVTLIELAVNKSSKSQEVLQMFTKYKPRMVVLIGNKAVNLYSQFQSKNSKMAFPPAIAMAALFIDEFASKLTNFTAIRYEIPIVTSAVSIRNILNKSVKKIGVIYRSWMKSNIKENQRIAGLFSHCVIIDLVSICFDFFDIFTHLVA